MLSYIPTVLDIGELLSTSTYVTDIYTLLMYLPGCICWLSDLVKMLEVYNMMWLQVWKKKKIKTKQQKIVSDVVQMSLYFVVVKVITLSTVQKYFICSCSYLIMEWVTQGIFNNNKTILMIFNFLDCYINC